MRSASHHLHHYYLQKPMVLLPHNAIAPPNASPMPPGQKNDAFTAGSIALSAEGGRQYGTAESVKADQRFV